MERPIELLSGIETLSVPRVTANLRKNLTVPLVFLSALTTRAILGHPNAKGENQVITLILLENLAVGCFLAFFRTTRAYGPAAESRASDTGSRHKDLSRRRSCPLTVGAEKQSWQY